MTPTFHNTATGSRRAIFPGSFNPFTIGHKSIVDRALPLFDHIIIAVGISIEKLNNPQSQSHIEAIRQLFADNDKVSVTTYSGLTVDAAKAHNCQFLLRGIRNSIDLEYERPMADTNRQLSGIETIFLLTLPEHSMISSSMVRELSHFGHDTTPYLP